MPAQSPAQSPAQYNATRFAPSPTGLLHLGHGLSALLAQQWAHENGAPFLLRFDDIDAARVRDTYYTATITDLGWLGVVPDAPPVRQSQRLPLYAGALDKLRDMGLAYPCFCSRKDLAQSAAAPHGPTPIYPGTCRNLALDAVAARLAAGDAPAWRLDMAAAIARTGALIWHDMAGGAHHADPAAHGDIVLARRDAPTSYHLSSTIDDAEMGISHVVRGADLHAATDVHRLLQALLTLPTPIYQHHPLVGDAMGRRLAKRDGAASLAAMRDAGVDGAQIAAQLLAGKLPLGYCWVKA